MRNYKLLIALGMVVSTTALLLMGMGVMNVDDRSRGEVDMPSNARRSPRILAKAGFDANAMQQKARQSGVLENEYSRMSLLELQEAAEKNIPFKLNSDGVRQFFARWAELDPHSAVEYVERKRSDGTTYMSAIDCTYMSDLYRQLSADDPGFAAQHSQHKSAGTPMVAFNVIPIISAEWAKQDVQSALNWVLGLDKHQHAALSTLMAEVAKQDPEKAAKMIGAIDLPDLRGTKNVIAEFYGTQDFDATMEWVDSMAENEKEGATRAAVRGLAKANPEAAVEFAASMQDGPRKEQFITDIIGVIALDDPAKAARLTENLRDEHALQKGIDSLIRPWALSDSDAALDYAMNLTNQHLRDTAINAYIRSADSIQPSMKVAIAESVSSDLTRIHLIQDYIRDWMDEDRVAAMKYLEATHKIPDDIKNRMLDNYSE